MPLSMPVVGEGAHNLALKGVDLAGQQVLKPNFFRWTKDTTPPTSCAVAVAHGATAQPSFVAALTGSEAGLTFWLQVHVFLDLL